MSVKTSFTMQLLCSGYEITTPWLHSVGDFNVHFIYSDGAPQHFKLTKIAHWISTQKVRHGTLMDWNYRGTSHGKDRSDGALGQDKNAADRHQMTADEGVVGRIQCAKDMFNFLNDSMFKRIYHFIPASGPGSINRRSLQVSTLSGIKKLHQIRDAGIEGQITKLARC